MNIDNMEVGYQFKNHTILTDLRQIHGTLFIKLNYEMCDKKIKIKIMKYKTLKYKQNFGNIMLYYIKLHNMKLIYVLR